MKIRIEESQRIVSTQVNEFWHHQRLVGSRSDTLSSMGVESSFFQRWIVEPFKAFINWLSKIFCCCKKEAEPEKPKEKSHREKQIEKVQELIDSFATRGKGETFKVWWQGIFSELDEEVQQMVFEEDRAARGLKQGNEPKYFVVELQSVLDLNGAEVCPQDKVPGYLLRVKEKLEKK